MINQLEDGNGVSFEILMNGKPEKFVLALFAKKDYCSEEFNRYEYGFINSDKTKYIRNCYSGGNTGFGENLRDIRFLNEPLKELEDELKLITTDLEEINKIAKEEEEKEEKRKQEISLNKIAKVEKINALPKIFSLPGTLGEIFEFSRSEASFNPKSSFLLQHTGGDIYLVIKNKNRCIFLENYKTRNGRLLTKSFERDYSSLFPNEKMENPKQSLEFLIEEEERLEQLINNL